MATKNTEATKNPPMANEPMMTAADYKFAQQYLDNRMDNTFRWGSRMLRGPPKVFNPCVLDRTGWEDYYLSLPYDYDLKNDPVYDQRRSTYNRLGDMGFCWPEPTTREATRTGYCGPDENSFTRPAFLRHRENDHRPEPAFRPHLTDRTYLHHLRADPLEGVLPFGRPCDMSDAKSVMHRDFKWRKKCCSIKPEQLPPTFESRVHRHIKTDIVGPCEKEILVDRVTKFRDEHIIDNFKKLPLLKLKKAYLWPIDTITGQPLGGRLHYYPEDPCVESRENIWPCGEKNRLDAATPLVIPDCRCSLLAHGPRKEKSWTVNWDNCKYPLCHLDPRCQTENVCEEVAYRYNDCPLPCECCFCRVETKAPPASNQVECPPNPPCPEVPSTLTQCIQ